MNYNEVNACAHCGIWIIPDLWYSIQIHNMYISQFNAQFNYYCSTFCMRRSETPRNVESTFQDINNRDTGYETDNDEIDDEELSKLIRLLNLG